MKNTICLTCHKDNSLEIAVKNLDRLLFRIDSYEGRIPTFNWNVKLNCKYGMYCADLKRTETHINQILTRLEPKIMTVIITKDDHMYIELLKNLRYYFPTVYNQVEKLYRTMHISEN